jgi:hypothetical protein
LRKRRRRAHARDGSLEEPSAVKPRVSARIPLRLHARLAGAAGRGRGGQSAVIVAALESFLVERPDAGRGAALERRLDRMSRQLDRLEQSGLVLEETLALLAQVYMTLTPAVPADGRAEARARGAARWAELETRLAGRIAAGRRTLARALEPVVGTDADGVASEAVAGDAEAAP